MSGAPGEPGRSPCVKFLSSLDSPSPHALTLLQVPDIRAWTSLEGHLHGWLPLSWVCGNFW